MFTRIEPVRMFTRIEPSKTIWTPAGTEYTDVSPGEKHVLLLTSSGDVYVFYHDGPAYSPRPPVRLQGIPKIQQISAGGRIGTSHNLLLAKNGEVFSFGDGDYGILGHGDTDKQLLPKLIEAMGGKKVVQVSAGQWHSLVLTESGEVYSFGDGSDGRLGHGDQEDQNLPKLIEAMRGKRVVQVSAGGYHSLVLTESGEVYSFGNGRYGQLGHGDVKNQTLPKLIKAIPNKEVIEAIPNNKVAQISAGYQHSLLLTEKHEVYSFGDGESGNLGHGDAKSQTRPKFIEALKGKNVKQICAYEHSLLLTETGFSAPERAEAEMSEDLNPALNFNVFLFGMQRGTIAESLSLSFCIVLLDISDNIADVLRPRSFERPSFRIDLAPESDEIPPHAPESDEIPPPVAVRQLFERSASSPSHARKKTKALPAELKPTSSQRYRFPRECLYRLRYTDCRSFAQSRARLRF